MPPCRDKRFRIRFERQDIPAPNWVEDPADTEFPTNDTYETTSVEFDLRRCEKVLRRVHDEVERLRAENYRCEEVVVPKADYARLFALTFKDAPYGSKPSHEDVEALVGVELTIVDRGTIQAVRDDPRRAVSEWAFDDGGEE